MSIRPGEAYGLLIGSVPTPAADHPAPITHFEAPPGSIANPYYPRSRDEAEGLPSGAHFYDPAGILRSRY